MSGGVFRRVASAYIGGPQVMRVATAVTLVTGPCGSGKTTYSRERMQDGDALIDLDLMWCALTGMPEHQRPDIGAPHLHHAVLAARDAAMWAVALDGNVPRLWVVACAPTQQQRAAAARPFADVRLVVLDVAADECERRVRAQGRAVEPWHRLIAEWWQQYQPPSDRDGWIAFEFPATATPGQGPRCAQPHSPPLPTPKTAANPLEAI